MRFPRLPALVALLGCPLLGGAAEGAPAFDSGDTAWILVATALVLFMTLPGLALFYGGLVRSKNVLSILVQCFGLAAIMSVVWVIVGYSLAFSDGGAANGIIGGFADACLWGLAPGDAVGGIPKAVHIAFQMTFFIITPALIVGGVAERIKFAAIALFGVLWGILCYIPICHMVWADGGYLFDWGVLDLAGGTVVHITAGIAALVACLVVGKRDGYPQVPMKPHNLTLTVMGAGMLWVGWFGFNGGSVLAADGGAAMALLVTHISSATATMTWMVIEWIRNGKPSALGMATGAIAGLATITPASGNVGPVGALVIGACAGLGCYWGAVWLKNKMGWDESLDAFGVHGVGGFIGVVMVAIFASPALGGYGAGDGYTMAGQLGKQLAAAGITVVWSAVVSLIVLLAIKATIGLRVKPEDEELGLDLAEHDERGYILTGD